MTLAVIPHYATAALAERLAGEAGIGIATHGLAHINHARAGEKSSEFGAGRAQADVMTDLQAGQERMRKQFGDHAMAVFVPPWNRIEAGFHTLLADCGYSALSTFGAKGEVAGGGLVAMPAHLDIMDWSKRTGREASDVDSALAGLLTARFDSDGDAPIGILAHHLVHDGTAWDMLDGLTGLCARHRAVEWLDLRECLDAQ